MALLWQSFVLIFSLHATLLLAQLQCPPLGPILPSPTNLTHNPQLQQVIAAINAQLQNFSSSLNATALSVGARSVHETAPLLSFHHTPSVFNKSGTHKVDGDTIYPIGSATKLFTALSILQLQGKVNLADPITKYVPRLAHMSNTSDPLLAVDWESVTVDALASHLSGIGADLTNNVIPDVPGITEATGLPPLTQSQDSLSCGGAPGTPGCTWDDFFDNFGRRPPVYAPFTTPVYSNIGYAILGRVIENVSGKSYAAYLEDAIFTPANMRRSFVGAPSNSSLGFIPSETNWWGTPLGYENSSGGIYSTNNDLLSFGAAILSPSSKLLASPARTRAWMKPRTFTSSSGVSVGAPWEIARGANLTADGRVIDFYTKTGNLGDYTAILALVPDYDLVVALNLAGPDSSIAAIQVIFSTLVQALLPAVAQVGQSEASQRYAGTYTSSSSSSGTGSNSSTITLSVDDYGLVVSAFSARGVDVRGTDTGYAALTAAGASETTGGLATTIRLYPTNLASGNHTAWRAVYQTTSAADLAAFDAQLFFPQGSCQSWTEVDLQTYGFQALDYFVFTADEDGVVVRVEPRAWRLVLDRVAA